MNFSDLTLDPTEKIPVVIEDYSGQTINVPAAGKFLFRLIENRPIAQWTTSINGSSVTQSGEIQHDGRDTHAGVQGHLVMHCSAESSGTTVITFTLTNVRSGEVMRTHDYTFVVA